MREIYSRERRRSREPTATVRLTFPITATLVAVRVIAGGGYNLFHPAPLRRPLPASGME